MQSEIIRSGREFVFSWADGATDSDEFELGDGTFGTLLVPTGSGLITKTLQFVAVIDNATGFAASDLELLGSPLTIAAGANALSEAQIAAVGAVQRCKLRVNTAVSGAQSAVLLWKS